QTLADDSGPTQKRPNDKHRACRARVPKQRRSLRSPTATSGNICAESPASVPCRRREPPGSPQRSQRPACVDHQNGSRLQPSIKNVCTWQEAGRKKSPTGGNVGGIAARTGDGSEFAALALELLDEKRPQTASAEPLGNFQID